MRRTTANDEALPPDVADPVGAPQGTFPFGPVGGAGAVAGPAATPPWGGPQAAAPAPAESEPFADAPFPAAPAPPLPWASTDVPTDVPPLDDVLGASAEVDGTFLDPDRNTGSTKSKGKGRGRGKSRGRSKGRRTDRASRSTDADTGHVADTGHDADTGAAGTERHDPPAGRAGRRRASRRARDGGSGVRDLSAQARTMVAVLPRRRVTGLFARRAALWAAGGLALAAGAGVGAGADHLGGEAEASTAAATAAVTEVTPEVCAAAQVAWSRAASAQVRMDVESPRSLRTGFVGARDALSMVDPPGAVITDWATVLTYVTAAADATQDVENDELEAAVAEALAELDTEQMTAASQRITDYLAADCAS